MAVGVTLDFDSLQLADYDAVCEALNFPPTGPTASWHTARWSWTASCACTTSGSPGPNSISSSPIGSEPR
jgi:hypothetical protein